MWRALMMGTWTLIPPILSRCASDGGVELKIMLIYGWTMYIWTLITKILKLHCRNIIPTISNGWISSDQAFGGLKVPCVQLRWRPHMGIIKIIKENSKGNQGNKRKKNWWYMKRGPLTESTSGVMRTSLHKTSFVDFFFFTFFYFI